MSFYPSDRFIQNNAFHILTEKYSEESRFYHNLSHIKSLLNLFEAFKDQIKEQDAVRFSIWFHDAVYDIKREDNEEESARLASELLDELNVSVETIGSVRRLILATKSHNGRDLSEDAKLFLDMDLAILGMNEETYERYSKAIREEYSWVSERTYRTGRRKILDSFLNQEKIYFTDAMQKRFEKQARMNIDNEIRALEVQ